MFAGKIDIPGRRDIKARKPLTINEIVDANNPTFQETPSGRVTKEVGCLCLKSGNLEFEGIDKKNSASRKINGYSFIFFSKDTLRVDFFFDFFFKAKNYRRSTFTDIYPTLNHN